MLAANDWMDRDTRVFAQDKAKQMLSLIGFPDFLYNDTELDEYYRNVSCRDQLTLGKILLQ